MFKRVRRSVKWHQKQIMVGGKWRHIPRLISWLGPCDYSHNGMVIEKNENWPPEILDLLHRYNYTLFILYPTCYSYKIPFFAKVNSNDSLRIQFLFFEFISFWS